MTIKLITAMVLAFLFSSAFGKFYVPWLRRIKAGQEIKENGPSWHMNKSGTPTMGGVMFILAAVLVCLTVGFDGMLRGEFVNIFILLFACVFGAIGFLDDWEKLAKKQNLGLSAKAKFLLQLVASLVFVLLMRQIGYVRPNFYLYFIDKTIYMPEWLYFLLSSFIIVGTVNAVNITDGLDGLAASTSIPVFLFFVAICMVFGDEFQQMGIMASAMVGGLLGFLIYNFNPAKCFMGDTGSLFLGGMITALAYAYNMPIILIGIGFVFLMETLSDIIQVSYFKLSHGKRVFKMAPFHHHLEMGGWTGRKWTEKQIVALFAGISTVTCIISFIVVARHYGLML
jgi:phospho-N-acetylmuramoyl-pentapeptide-transferase